MKVYLRGFFYANLGDDLFIHMMAQRYPHIKFVIIVNSKYSYSYSSENNIDIIKFNKVIRGMDKLINKMFPSTSLYHLIEKKADLSVVIGGSLFQEFVNDSEALGRLKMLPGKYHSTYILGANFGPYVTQTYLQTAQNYFRRVQDICFRDSWSFQMFEDIDHIRYAPDIVFGIESLVKKVTKKEKTYVISVMNFAMKNNLASYITAYKKFIINIASYYSAYDYDVILVSFCKMEGDEIAIDEILSLCTSNLRNKLKVVKYNGINWKQIVQLISSATYLVATRFHSMILGFVFNVPTLPVIYSNKCLHVMQDIGCDNGGIKLDELDGFSIENARYIEIENISEIKKRSQEQFKILDSVLLEQI